MIPFDKNNVQKGMFLTGGEFPAREHLDHKQRVADHKALQRRHPEMSSVLESVGPPPTDVQLEKLARERAELAAKMVDIKQRLDAYGKGKRNS